MSPSASPSDVGSCRFFQNGLLLTRFSPKSKASPPSCDLAMPQQRPKHDPNRIPTTPRQRSSARRNAPEPTTIPLDTRVSPAGGYIISPVAGGCWGFSRAVVARPSCRGCCRSKTLGGFSGFLRGWDAVAELSGRRQGAAGALLATRTGASRGIGWRPWRRPYQEKTIPLETQASNIVTFSTST